MRKIAALLVLLTALRTGFAEYLPEVEKSAETWVPAPEAVEFFLSEEGTTTLYDHAYGVAITYPSGVSEVAEASAGYACVYGDTDRTIRFQYLVSRSDGRTLRELAEASGAENIAWIGEKTVQWSKAQPGYWETVLCSEIGDDFAWIFLRCPPERAAEQEELAGLLTIQEVEADRPQERVDLTSISQFEPASSRDGIYISRKDGGILLLKEIDQNTALVELDTYNELGEPVHIMPVVMSWENPQEGTGTVSFRDMQEEGQAVQLTFRLNGKVMTVEQQGELVYDFSGKYDYAVPFLAFDDSATEYYIQQLPAAMTNLDAQSYDWELEGKTSDDYYYIINAYLSGTDDCLAQFYAAYDLSVIFRTEAGTPVLVDSDPRICESIYLCAENLWGNEAELDSRTKAIRFQPVLPLYFDGFDLKYVCISSNPDVAVVNDDGMVLPRSAGTVAIELYVEYEGQVYEARSFSLEITSPEPQE